ncbi:hypothetical protein EVAR_34616_1 [Eumeta japonica]|uniref:Uncharacterized protein n=1 Tax=Eumeta variegata TaxID=151549 RepID=A0A4C1VG33_EUMVA|nr:hypothetical protein EVAR_34616_1 [Eumeta japonica]
MQKKKLLGLTRNWRLYIKPWMQNKPSAYLQRDGGKLMLLDATAPSISGSKIWSETIHTLIVSSKRENSTAEQVIAKLYGAEDAKEMCVAVDPLRKARNQKVVEISAEESTNHVSLQFIQSNLQRHKLAISELPVKAERKENAQRIFEDMVSVLQESAPVYDGQKWTPYFNKDESCEDDLAQGVL